MKKNIGNSCNPCIIEIPEHLHHNQNMLSWMVDNIAHERHKLIKQNFTGSSMVCIKKDESKLIGHEYYFLSKTIHFPYVANILWMEYYKEVEKYNFSEYSFDFHNEACEINMFDATTISYIVDTKWIEMKSVYFWFQQHEALEAFKNLRKTIYPYTEKQLLEVLRWNKYQRKDGNIIVWKKKNADSIYFSKINFEGFSKFVSEFWWDTYIWWFLEKNSQYLEYYVFDINLQYTYSNGKMKIWKTSIYWVV